jgi:hypothetical protein
VSFFASDLFFFLLTYSYQLFLLNADACLESKAEARHVNAHLCAAQTHVNSIMDSFWVSRLKAIKLTVLQDRITQARALAESSHAALAIVHQAMFPLNNQPKGLPTLLSQFENGEAIYRFVHEHLQCEALVALSFVRVHYPEVDMELVKKLPPTPSGRADMTAHYSACRQTADFIAAQIVTESDQQRAGQNPLLA